VVGPYAKIKKMRPFKSHRTTSFHFYFESESTGDYTEIGKNEKQTYPEEEETAGRVTKIPHKKRTLTSLKSGSHDKSSDSIGSYR